MAGWKIGRVIGYLDGEAIEFSLGGNGQCPGEWGFPDLTFDLLEAVRCDG